MQVSLCLPKTKYIVHVKNNTINYAGSPDSIELENQIPDPEVHLRPEPSAQKDSDLDTGDKGPEAKLPIKKAKNDDPRTDLKIYATYFLAAGGLGFTCLFIFGLVIKQLSKALTTWLLGRINSTRPKVFADQAEKTLPVIGNLDSGLQRYLYIYLGSSLLTIALEFLLNLYTFEGSIRASKNLFNRLTFKVLRMPMLWLDNTPIGSLIKAFTVDTKMLDDMVLQTLSEFLDVVVRLATITAIG